MKQFEVVIQTLEHLGGQATLAELYREVMKVEDCRWESKTPFAFIRRIVQIRPEIFRVRPGLWALRSYQTKLGLVEQDSKGRQTTEAVEHRRAEFEQKVRRSALDATKNRVNFLGYNLLVKQYEYEMLKASHEFAI
jgi:hypothetical protein